MTINEILMVTSSSPKCGIATYSQDLIKSIEDKYCDSFTIKVCALQKNMLSYIILVKSLIFLKQHKKEDYKRPARAINEDESVKIIYLQHEFGLYGGVLGDYILDFLSAIENYYHNSKLANPDDIRKKIVQKLRCLSQVIVMTNLSAKI
jgi:hypothetical protein